MCCHLGFLSSIHLFEYKTCACRCERSGLHTHTHMGMMTFKCHLKDWRGQITGCCPSWRHDSLDFLLTVMSHLSTCLQAPVWKCNRVFLLYEGRLFPWVCLLGGAMINFAFGLKATMNVPVCMCMCKYACIQSIKTHQWYCCSGWYAPPCHHFDSIAHCPAPNVNLSTTNVLFPPVCVPFVPKYTDQLI